MTKLIIVEAESTHGCRRIAATHNTQTVDFGESLRKRFRASGERFELKNAHWAIPKNGLRSSDYFRKSRCRFGSDIETEPGRTERALFYRRRHCYHVSGIGRERRRNDDVCWYHNRDTEAFSFGEVPTYCLDLIDLKKAGADFMAKSSEKGEKHPSADQQAVYAG